MIVTVDLVCLTCCLCRLIFFLSRSDALCHQQTGSSLQHIFEALEVILSTVSAVYKCFVIQLLSEPDKQNVACLFKRQLLILSRTQN